MLAIFIYTVSLLSVGIAYWFLVSRRNIHIKEISAIHGDLNQVHWVYFICNTKQHNNPSEEQVKWRIVAWNLKNWKVVKSSFYPDKTIVLEQGIQEIQNLANIAIQMDFSFSENNLPFPVYFNNEDRIEDDYIHIETEGNSMKVRLYRNKNLINTFRLSGVMERSSLALYLKSDHTILFSYKRKNWAGERVAFFMLNLLNGNLAGEATL